MNCYILTFRYEFLRPIDVHVAIPDFVMFKIKDGFSNIRHSNSSKSEKKLRSNISNSSYSSNLMCTNVRTHLISSFFFVIFSTLFTFKFRWSGKLSVKVVRLSCISSWLTFRTFLFFKVRKMSKDRIRFEQISDSSSSSNIRWKSSSLSLSSKQSMFDSSPFKINYCSREMEMST